MVYSFMKALLATSLLASAVCAFSVHSDKAPTLTSRFATKASASDVDFSNDRNTASSSSARRSLLFRGVAAVVATTAVAAPPALAAGTTRTKGNAALGAGTVVGREIDTFNSLIYNFKNIDLGGGLDASTLQEPSVPFVEFGEKMKAGACGMNLVLVGVALSKGKTEGTNLATGPLSTAHTLALSFTNKLPLIFFGYRRGNLCRIPSTQWRCCLCNFQGQEGQDSHW